MRRGKVSIKRPTMSMMQGSPPVPPSCQISPRCGIYLVNIDSGYTPALALYHQDIKSALFQEGWWVVYTKHRLGPSIYYTSRSKTKTQISSRCSGTRCQAYTRQKSTLLVCVVYEELRNDAWKKVSSSFLLQRGYWSGIFLNGKGSWYQYRSSLRAFQSPLSRSEDKTSKMYFWHTKQLYCYRFSYSTVAFFYELVWIGKQCKSLEQSRAKNS